VLLFFSLGLFFFVLNSFERLLDTFCRLKLGSRRMAIKIVYCPWAIRENPASSAANQIARFIKTNACHIIITYIYQPICTYFPKFQLTIFSRWVFSVIVIAQTSGVGLPKDH
jgi:hypothetical protein